MKHVVLGAGALNLKIGGWVCVIFMESNYTIYVLKTFRILISEKRDLDSCNNYSVSAEFSKCPD